MNINGVEIRDRDRHLVGWLLADHYDFIVKRKMSSIEACTTAVESLAEEQYVIDHFVKIGSLYFGVSNKRLYYDVAFNDDREIGMIRLGYNP